MKGSTSGKTLGVDPKFMIARSVSSRSHMSIRCKNKSKRSKDGEVLKAQLDQINTKYQENERKNSEQQKKGYQQVGEQESAPTEVKDVKLESCDFESGAKVDNKQNAQKQNKERQASKNKF